uniref:Uncharacterized protein n=1 Tax=Anopheles melas TaxID=34690 RepID=A0A182TQ37_9DIPT
MARTKRIQSICESVLSLIRCPLGPFRIPLSHDVLGHEHTPTVKLWPIFDGRFNWFIRLLQLGPQVCGSIKTHHRSAKLGPGLLIRPIIRPINVGRFPLVLHLFEKGKGGHRVAPIGRIHILQRVLGPFVRVTLRGKTNGTIPKGYQRFPDGGGRLGGLEHRAPFRYLIVRQVGTLKAPADRCVRSLEDALPALVAVHSDRFGWYLVWKLFLSRFKLVRELLGIAQSNEHSPVHSATGRDYSTAAGSSGVVGGGSSIIGGSINADNRSRTRKVRRD